MKVTKLVHSCVVLEEHGKKILVDPGSYSWASGLVKDEHLQSIDAIVITHNHPDHLNQNFVDAINKNSPDAKWYGVGQVVEDLEQWNIAGNVDSKDPDIQFVDSLHADLSPWFSEQPEHSSFLIFGKVLIGGDCHTLNNGQNAEVFGAAVSGGPWGAVVGFSKMIEAMQDRPKKVIPLHDWHWNEEARQAIYKQLPDVLGQFGVEFIALQSGVAQEI